MATLNIPDNTPVAALKQALAAVGKSLQYRPATPKPEDSDHVPDRTVDSTQPATRLAD